MKNSISLMVLLVIGSMLSAQNGCQPPNFSFNNMKTVSGTGGLGSVYQFTNVVNGVDAFITITKTQNATTVNSKLDMTGSYPLAWQPYITFPSSKNSASDSSYIEFRIEFKTNSGTIKLIDQNCMAMTIVDCDGPNNSNTYREMVKVSLPGAPKGVLNSTITVFQDNKWILYKAGPTTFNNIDTNNAAAMGQTNFPSTVNTFYMRIGVVGPISANLERQFSFYFKSFSGLVVPLPVQLINYQAVQVGNDAEVRWQVSDEKHMDRYEVYRSLDGKNFELLGTLKAKNAQQILDYTYDDKDITRFRQGRMYYRLKLVDLEGRSTWGDITMLSLEQMGGNRLSSVYPNPASDIVHFDLGNDVEDTEVSIEVLDIFGKSISTHQDPVLTGTVYSLDIQTMEKGLYFVHIYYSDGSMSTNRFIKY